MLVEETMPTARQRLATLADNAQLINAARLLRKAGTDILVVCGSDGRLNGVTTKTDIVRQVSDCQGFSRTTAASSVMTRDVVACRPDDLLHKVSSNMRARGLKNVPVTDRDARPLGALNARDALQALMQDVEDAEALLWDYVMCVGYH